MVAAYFLDTSALVKRYIPEIGTAWMRTLTAQASNNLLLVSRITITPKITRKDFSSLGEYRFGECIFPFAKQITHRYFLCSLWPTAFALSINKQVFTFLGNSETSHISGGLAHGHHFLRHTR
jgi:hypothetical protein